ncbi:hypothetical protein DSO57_1028775 [Entomophthora muscae]|uniref:Uncharacterized protein n=1 Tax=Entomophthora muscae TaxID=34485 RepID=A0ACC2TZX4_9FUNG|nr:hypothetical protein DSO57_1028775 [Entomophthora muscae]
MAGIHLWHLVENPPDASRVALDSGGRIPSSSGIRFRRFGFPYIGGIRKRKRGRVDGTITAFAVIVQLSSDAALSGWEGK